MSYENGGTQHDRRTADRDWRVRVEKDLDGLKKQLEELIRIKQQVIGGSKVVVGFVTVLTGSAGFAYVVIQIVKVAVHGL